MSDKTILTKHKINVVLIEDSASDARIIYELLEDGQNIDYAISWHTTLAAGLDYLKTGDCEIVLTDMHLPDASGSIIFEMIHKIHPNLPIIALSGIADRDTEQETINLGAQDFLPKDGFHSKLLIRTIKYAIDRCRKERELVKSRESLSQVVKNNRDAIIIVDKQGVIELFNPAAELLFGRTATEMIGTEFGFVVSDGISTEIEIVHLKDRIARIGEMRSSSLIWNGQDAFLVSIRDITERVEAMNLLKLSNQEMRDTVKNGKALPICASCKKIRDKKDVWHPIEEYFMDHYDMVFSHGMCPDCMKKWYPDYVAEKEAKEGNGG